MPTTPAAQDRIARALGHIQAAQRELERACAELSTLRHGMAVWKAAGKIHERVHALWYRVRNLQHSNKPITVDSEPEARNA